MNVRRGLFRLWLVLAATFLVLVAIARGPKIEREFVEAPAVAASEAKSFAEIDDAVANAQSAVAAAQFDIETLRGRPHPRRSIDDFLPKPHKPDVAAQLRVAYGHAWMHLRQGVALALGVPLLVLAFGQGVLWATAGFGRRAALSHKPKSD